MAAVDRGDSTWFERQPDDVKKDFKAFLFLRWLSAVPDGKRSANTLMMANEINQYFTYELCRDHPELIFKLAAMWCSAGVVVKHQWTGVPGKRTNTDSNKAWQLVADYNPGASAAEIDMLMRLHTRETFAQFTRDAAVESKELMVAYDNLKKATNGNS
ncbi:unnamed protein product [Sphagnum tenellum]